MHEANHSESTSPSAHAWVSLDSVAPAVRASTPNWRARLVGGLGTLKARLTLVVVVALALGIGAISFLSLAQVERDLLARAQASEVAQTARMASELSQRVVALQQAIRLMAEQVEPGLERDDEAMGRHLQAQRALLQQFSNLFYAVPDGQLKLTLDEAGTRRPEVSLADRAYFQRVLKEKRPIISEPVPGRVSGEPVIVFAHPIIRNGSVAAVIGGALRLSSRSLAASLLDRNADGDADELLAITDEAGKFLAHPHKDLLLRPVDGEVRLAEAAKDWQVRGGPAEPTGLLLPQPHELTTVAGVAGTDWLIWRAVPLSSLTQPLHQVRWTALREATAVIGGLGLLTLGLVAYLLRPLTQLQQRALHLFDSDRSIHEGWPTEVTEVVSLARVLRHVGAERAQLEAFTHEVLGKLNSVMTAAPLGIGFTRNQRFELVNRAWCQLVQREELDLVGSRAVDLFVSDLDYQQLGHAVRTAFADSGEYVGEWRLRRGDGTIFWGQLNARPVSRQSPSEGTIWMLADISDLRASRESLEWSATHDPLTGLANRTAFVARLQRVFGHPPAALIVIDLDRFKPINDTFGHGAGDAMLKEVAHTLSAQVRSGDLAVRMGGDEFALVLERCPPDAAARVVADVERAIARIEVPWGGQSLTVGASAGLAPLTSEFASIEAWVAAADQACYEAKAARKRTGVQARGNNLRVIG